MSSLINLWNISKIYYVSRKDLVWPKCSHRQHHPEPVHNREGVQLCIPTTLSYHLIPLNLCSYWRVSWWATTDVEFENLDFQATDISDGLFSLKCTNESKTFRFLINYAWLHLGSWWYSRAYRLIGIPHKQSCLWVVVFLFILRTS